MAKNSTLTKRVLVNKANQTIVMVTAAAAFITVFCLVASKTLISQEAYQNRVITAKNTAKSQLSTDVTNVSTLDSSYQSFNAGATNLLGGNAAATTGNSHGTNGELVLDAVPSQYDFPAVATAIENLITQNQLTVVGISGVDQELAEQNNNSSPTPAAVPIPFSFSATGTYGNIEALITNLENSIRPIQINAEVLSGSENKFTAAITAQTYYQPGVSFTIGSETIQ